MPDERPDYVLDPERTLDELTVADLDAVLGEIVERYDTAPDEYYAAGGKSGAVAFHRALLHRLDD